MSEMENRVDNAIEEWLRGRRPEDTVGGAAIAAMREPTPEMIAAGRGILVGFLPGDVPERIWQAMIDATLKEKSE